MSDDAELSHEMLLYRLMPAVQRANEARLAMKNRETLLREAVAEVEHAIKLLEQAGLPQNPVDIVDELIIWRDASKVDAVTRMIRGYLGFLHNLLQKARTNDPTSK